ncbi:MAG: hypothetical protein HYW77_02815 [Parcubacteria group bacterium]|nr:hypothetical protein [Parcubacteria group bacterium]
MKDPLTFFKNLGAKIIAPILIFSITFVFNGFVFAQQTCPSGQVTTSTGGCAPCPQGKVISQNECVSASPTPSSNLPKTCDPTDNQDLLSLISTLSKLANSLKQATSSGSPQDFQKIVQQFNNALDQLSVLTNQQTGDIKQCTVDVKKAIQDIQIPGLTTSKGGTLQGEFGQIVSQFNQLIGDAENSINQIQTLITDVQKAIDQVSALQTTALTFHKGTKATKDVMSAVVDSNILIAPVLNPIIAGIVSILNSLSSEVVSVLTDVLYQLQTVLAQAQTAINQVHTQTLLQAQALVGNLDIKSFQNSINQMAGFCLNSQNTLSGLNGLLGNAGGAFGGLLSRYSNVNVGNTGQSSSPLPTGVSSSVKDQLDELGNKIIEERSDAEDKVDDFNKTQSNLSGVGQRFEDVCSFLIQSSTNNLNSLKQGQLDSVEIDKLVNKIQDLEKSLVSTSIRNVNDQFQPQLDSAVLTLSSLKSLIEALNISSGPISRKMNEIEAKLNQLRDASEIMESYSEELEEENTQRKFGEFSVVISSTASELLFVVEGLQFILSQIEARVPTPTPTF